MEFLTADKTVIVSSVSAAILYLNHELLIIAIDKKDIKGGRLSFMQLGEVTHIIFNDGIARSIDFIAPSATELGSHIVIKAYLNKAEA